MGCHHARTEGTGRVCVRAVGIGLRSGASAPMENACRANRCPMPSCSWWWGSPSARVGRPQLAAARARRPHPRGATPRVPLPGGADALGASPAVRPGISPRLRARLLMIATAVVVLGVCWWVSPARTGWACWAPRGAAGGDAPALARGRPAARHCETALRSPARPPPLTAGRRGDVPTMGHMDASAGAPTRHCYRHPGRRTLVSCTVCERPIFRLHDPGSGRLPLPECAGDGAARRGPSPMRRVRAASASGTAMATTVLVAVNACCTWWRWCRG